MKGNIVHTNFMYSIGYNIYMGQRTPHLSFLYYLSQIDKCCMYV